MTNRSTVDLKVIIVGDADVGKTCLLLRYMEKRFNAVGSTIGASFLLKHWNDHSIAIWDTAGEERFSGLGSYYFRSAGAAILAFDLSREESLDVLRNRFVPMLEYAEKDCLIAVVGTKHDLVNRAMSKRCSALVKNFMKSLNEQLTDCSQIRYFETSSLSGHNVDKVFECIFELYFSRISKIKLKKVHRGNAAVPNISLNTSSKKPEQVSCCSL